jgi:hypothetical protein
MGAVSFILGLVTWAGGQAGLLGVLPHTAQTVLQAVAAVATVLGIRSASTDPSSAIINLLAKAGTGWKTAAGASLAAVGFLLSPDVFALFPANVAHILTVAGEVLTALGLYHANGGTESLTVGAVKGP